MTKPPAGPKIALVIPDFAGGGAERAAVNLACALVDLGADTRFIVEKMRGALAEEARVVDAAEKEVRQQGPPRGRRPQHDPAAAGSA